MLDTKQCRFHVLVPLWGPAYIVQARQFLFSSLLAPGNLSGDMAINLHIIGKKSEEALIVDCPEWQPISKICNAQFDGLDDSIFDEMSYFAMSHCYDHALSKYEAPESVFVFLTADIVLAKNTFSFLKSLVDEGYRAAMVPGPRVREEAVEHLRRSDGVLVAEGRDLMRAMWEKPLALTEGYQVMENGRNKCPMHYYWRVGQYSTLARNMMMHPLMVWPDNTSARVVCPPTGANAASAALDQGYMRYAVARNESIYVGSDSDKLAVVSISSDDHFSNDIMIQEGYTLEQEKGIFSAYCNSYHFWYGTHDLLLKGEDVEPEAWKAARGKAAATIKAKMDFIKMLSVTKSAPSNPQPEHGSLLSRMFSRRLRGQIGRIPYARQLYKGIQFLFPWGLKTSVQNLSLRLAVLEQETRTTQQFLTEVFASYRWLENCDPESITCKAPLGHHSALRARYIYKEAFYVAIDYLISNQILGPVLEFGSRSGFTSRCLGETMAERNFPGKLYLFDSFEGLPDIKSDVDLRSPEVSEQKVWFKGAMAMPNDTVELISRDLQRFMQPHQFEIVKGYFSETLPRAVPEEPVAMVHIDCDLYQSTMEVLETLNERKLLQNGSILMFDDYNTSKADPKLGERRALADLLQRNKTLSVSPFLTYNWHGQAFILHVDDLA
jgi:O-methyltransferase